MTLTVVLYVFVFAAKLVTYFITDMAALYGEALHTLSDIFIYGFLLVAAIWSRKEPTQVHMFGYGRAQNVAALIAATILIAFTSYQAYTEAVPRLLRPAAAEYQSLGLGVAVIVISMFIAAAPLVSLFTQKKRGAAAKAQLVALLNDEMGLTAALIATLLVIRGYPIADPIATIIVATIIAYSAVGLLRENSSVLLGRSPGPAFLAQVEREALSVDGVLGVHDLRAEYIAPEVVHVGMHIEVRPDLSVQAAERIAEEVDRRVHAATRPGYCVIHVDPAAPEKVAAATKAVGAR